ncbi:peptidoglycan editing factor PgeF [Roseibium aggregatum]|uniref:Purine nucleoside phosphorylase n=1 Tax=Roseibium aggregatum TaxID=187304 RepID=A0A926P4C7_9HYPH|nr:peptidoglycan editing factor PgeF [Roseibium aggregatum]MBD1547211.1 peptidoglycan editing factor PgeF [Roseibium aggregatum]
MIEAEELKQPGVRHGFFTRRGGVSSGIYDSLNIGTGSRDHPEQVAENRARVARQLGIDPSRLATPYQIHSAEVITLNAPFDDNADRRGDALVTDRPGLLIGVATADCGPVLFADREAGVIGAAHSGWKGAISGILENTVAAMEALGADRSRIAAVLGPTISQAAYEVGPEFRERLLEMSQENERYFRPSPREHHHQFDLPAFIVDRLKAAGLENSRNLDLCTYADEERFFSYRRTTHRGEPDYGRLISAIVLDGD